MRVVALCRNSVYFKHSNFGRANRQVLRSRGERWPSLEWRCLIHGVLHHRVRRHGRCVQLEAVVTRRVDPLFLFRRNVAAFAAACEGGAEFVLAALLGVVLVGDAGDRVYKRVPRKLIDVRWELRGVRGPAAVDLAAELEELLDALRVPTKLSLPAG